MPVWILEYGWQLETLANAMSLVSFQEDKSNYWTANLYFKARNGTYKRVPQIANQFNDDDNAGLTVYYTSSAPNVTTAFKPVNFHSWQLFQPLLIFVT
jgi:hypothetical protein